MKKDQASNQLSNQNHKSNRKKNKSEKFSSDENSSNHQNSGNFASKQKKKKKLQESSTKIQANHNLNNTNSGKKHRKRLIEQDAPTTSEATHKKSSYPKEDQNENKDSWINSNLEEKFKEDGRMFNTSQNNFVSSIDYSTFDKNQENFDGHNNNFIKSDEKQVFNENNVENFEMNTLEFRGKNFFEEMKNLQNFRENFCEISKSKKIRINSEEIFGKKNTTISEEYPIFNSNENLNKNKSNICNNNIILNENFINIPNKISNESKFKMEEINHEIKEKMDNINILQNFSWVNKKEKILLEFDDYQEEHKMVENSYQKEKNILNGYKNKQEFSNSIHDEKSSSKNKYPIENRHENRIQSNNHNMLIDEFLIEEEKDEQNYDENKENIPYNNVKNEKLKAELIYENEYYYSKDGKFKVFEDIIYNNKIYYLNNLNDKSHVINNENMNESHKDKKFIQRENIVNSNINQNENNLNQKKINNFMNNEINLNEENYFNFTYVEDLNNHNEEFQKTMIEKEINKSMHEKNEILKFRITKILPFHSRSASEIDNDFNEKNNLLRSEQMLFFKRNFSYMENQINVRPHMRRILLDWLNEISSSLNFKKSTFHLSIVLLDVFLSRFNNLQVNKLQLSGVTCLIIAAKLEEILVPNVQVFANATDNAVTREEIVSQEQYILKIFEFSVNFPSFSTWLDHTTVCWDEFVENIDIFAEGILINIEFFHFFIFRQKNIQSFNLYRKFSQYIDVICLDIDYLLFSEKTLCLALIYFMIVRDLGLIDFTEVAFLRMKDIENIYEFNIFFNKFLNRYYDLELGDIINQIQYVSCFVDIDFNFEQNIEEFVSYEELLQTQFYNSENINNYLRSEFRRNIMRQYIGT